MKACSNCYAVNDDNAAVCANCGAPFAAGYAQPQAPVYAQPAYAQQRAAVPAPNTLVFGILSLVFSCLFYTAIVGMILGIIGKSKANAYVAQGGISSGKVKTGSILSTVGMILGIVFSVILLIIVIIAAANS